MDAAVQDLVGVLRNLEEFSADSFSNRLFNKLRLCDNINDFVQYIPAEENYGERQEDLSVDGVDASVYLRTFAEQAFADGLCQVDDKKDKFKLKDCVQRANVKAAKSQLLPNLTSLFYAEHINWALETAGKPSLTELRGRNGFAEAYEKRVRSQAFVSSEIAKDLLAGNHEYSLAILFVCEYLHHGPGTVPSVDDEISQSRAASVLCDWIRHFKTVDAMNVLSGLFSKESMDLLATISKASSMVFAVTVDTNLRSTGLIDLAGAILRDPALSGALSDIYGGIAAIKDAIGERLSALLAIDIQSWKSHCQVLESTWETLAAQYGKAASQAVSKAEQSSIHVNGNDGEEFGRGFLTGVTFGAAGVKYLQTTTVTGQQVADWINRGRHSFPTMFKADAPNVKEVDRSTETYSPIASCFVAGTKIATIRGNIPIEDIREGEHILTDNETIVYGTASDEQVVSRLSVPILIGFNDEPAFFTPGHVFHTTKGLRAITPDIAQAENAWLQVGKLAVGNIIYRRKPNGKGYDQVPIDSIQVVQNAKVQMVYGIHMRDGHRRYHANGYLVAVNYPEITIKSIARLLSTFKSRERMRLLRGIKELQPLFHRFGVDQMDEILGRELGQITAVNTTATRCKVQHKHRSSLLQVRRTFALHPTTRTPQTKDYTLPKVKIHEGSLLIDGKVVPRVQIDTKLHTIRWTRPEPTHGWEHGYIRLWASGFDGVGSIYVSSEEDANADSPAREGLPTIPFIVTKANVNPHDEKAALQHAAVKITHPNALSPDLHKDLIKPVPFRLQGMSSTGIADSPRRAIAAFAEPESDESYTDGEDYYNVFIDKDPWAVKTEKGQPSSPVTFGKISFATHHVGGAEGMSLPTVQIEVLDEIRNAINQGKPLDQQIGPLYECVTELDDKSNIVATIDMVSPTVISALAVKPAPGQGQTSDDVLPPTFDVDFADHSPIKIKLPFFFTVLKLTMSWDFESVEGVAYAWDPTKVGSLGTRYKVAGQHIDVSTTLAVRRSIATSLAAIHATPPALTGLYGFQPAPVTLALADTGNVGLNTSALAEMPDYNDATLQTTSQGLLQKAMLYHMEEGDRQNFVGVVKPTVDEAVFPNELADNLPDDLKTWLKDTYTPAYISYMLSQVDTSSETWKGDFNAEQRNKIWYWWTGQGDGCLAKSSEYNKLNHEAATAAMKVLYGGYLEPYKADGASWAQKWGKQCTKPIFVRNVMKKPITAAFNPVLKYCNILNYLDPSKDYAEGLYKATIAQCVTKTLSSAYINRDDKDAAQASSWLKDSMLVLITKVLNDDPAITEPIRSNLKKDLAEFQKGEAVYDNLNAEQKAAHIMEVVATLTVNLSGWMSAIGKGLGAAFKQFSRWGRATAIFDAGLQKLLPAAAGRTALLKGLYSIAMVGMYGYMAYSQFAQWSTAKPEAKASAIIATLTLAVESAKVSYSAFQSVKAWRQSVADQAQQQIDAVILDDSFDVVARKDSSFLIIEKELQAEFPELGIQEAIGEKIAENTGATIYDPDLDMEYDEMFDVPLNDIEPPLPAGKVSSRLAKAFNTPANWLKAANILLGVAMTVTMSISLYRNWGDLTKTGKALGVVQVVIQALTVIADVVAFGVDIAVTAGVIAADCTLALAIPFVGAVLAVIGVVILILSLVLTTQEKKDPPLTTVETFLADKGQPWVAGLKVDPPAQSLRYLPEKNDYTAGSQQTVKISIQNPSDKSVELNETRLSFVGGTGDNDLFTDTTLALKTPAQDGPIVASVDGLVSAKLVPTIKGEDTFYDLVLKGIGGASNTTSRLIIPANKTFTVEMAGTINKAGKTILGIVETLSNGDRCRTAPVFTRK